MIAVAPAAAVWTITGLGALIVSVSAYRLIKGLIRRLSGQRILVIGATGVGKSALIYFLGGKTKPGTQTDQPQKFKSFVAEASDDKLYIREGYDVPGGDSYYGVWKRDFLAADFVFYLIDVDRIQREMNDDYRTTISIHRSRIRRWFGEAKQENPRKLLIVGTHYDRLPAGQRSHGPPRCLVDFRMALVEHSNRTEIVFGSLKNRTRAKRLIIKIVKTIERAMEDG